MKTQLLNYLLETSICLAIFYLFFKLFLQKEVFFSINRAYILLAIILSLLIPVIEIPLQEENTVIQQFIVLQTIPAIGTQSQSSQGLNLVNVMWILYAGICLLLVGRVNYQISKLLYYSRQFKQSRTSDYRLILTDGKMPTFSFFHLLFWDNSKSLSEEQQLQIVKHELTHIRQWHSLDILFMELVKIIFWFHPAVYFFKSALQHIHEYLADAAVARGHNREAYIGLLASQTLQTMNISFTHSFHQFSIKNRIRMLQKLKNAKPAFWKIALSLPIIAVLVFVYSCHTDEHAEPQAKITHFKAYTDDPDELLNSYKGKYPNIAIESLEVIKNPGQPTVVKATVKNVNNPDEKRKIEDELSQLLSKSAKEIFVASSQKATGANNEIFSAVEQQPSPVGGYETFYKYIGENIRYPQQARAKEIEGKVFVQFVVREDGSISDVKILKGIGHGCDEEALQVILNSPKWNPGMQRDQPVNVQMSVPIAFKL
jgi:TonB family protein